MQAILLAGGLGTRLKSVVSDRPKPMALIDGKPFMEYLVRQLMKQQVDHIIFAVGYKGSMVEEYFNDGSRLGVKITYSYEAEPLGTGGAIKLAAQYVTEPQVLVLNADTFYQTSYSRLQQVFQEDQLDMALVLRTVTDISRYGEAILTAGRLTGFNEKSAVPRKGTINGGVYLLKKELIEEIGPGKISLENELIPKWLEDGRKLGGFVNEGYFIDIGIPEDYFQFQEDVKRGVVR